MKTVIKLLLILAAFFNIFELLFATISLALAWVRRVRLEPAMEGKAPLSRAAILHPPAGYMAFTS